jgi:hypothetical protein
MFVNVVTITPALILLRSWLGVMKPIDDLLLMIMAYNYDLFDAERIKTFMMQVGAVVGNQRGGDQIQPIFDVVDYMSRGDAIPWGVVVRLFESGKQLRIEAQGNSLMFMQTQRQAMIEGINSRWREGAPRAVATPYAMTITHEPLELDVADIDEQPSTSMAAGNLALLSADDNASQTSSTAAPH